MMLNKKMLFFAIALFTASSISYAQDNYGISFGVNGGIDINQNGYKLDSEVSPAFEYYGKNQQWNIGADFGVAVTQKFRPRIEFKYVHTAYGMNFPTEYNSTYASHMITTLHYFDVNLRFDYQLVKLGRFQAFASPALKSEFKTGKKVKTYYVDGETSSLQLTDVKNEYPKTLAGGAFGLLLKYNFNDFVGVTLTPEYTYFFRNYVLANNKPYTRTSVNLGFEYKF